jgi:hypothetical protein
MSRSGGARVSSSEQKCQFGGRGKRSRARHTNYPGVSLTSQYRRTRLLRFRGKELPVADNVPFDRSLPFRSPESCVARSNHHRHRGNHNIPHDQACGFLSGRCRSAPHSEWHRSISAGFAIDCTRQFNWQGSARESVDNSAKSRSAREVAGLRTQPREPRSGVL